MISKHIYCKQKVQDVIDLNSQNNGVNIPATLSFKIFLFELMSINFPGCSWTLKCPTVQNATLLVCCRLEKASVTAVSFCAECWWNPTSFLSDSIKRPKYAALIFRAWYLTALPLSSIIKKAKCFICQWVTQFTRWHIHSSNMNMNSLFFDYIPRTPFYWLKYSLKNSLC